MKAISPFALGATLYMPATRDDILDVVFGMKIPELRSLVVCLEDAVAAIDVESPTKGSIQRKSSAGIHSLSESTSGPNVSA